MERHCRNSLALANEKQLKSVAFPAISCGVYGYPIPDAAKVQHAELHSEAACCSLSFQHAYCPIIHMPASFGQMGSTTPQLHHILLGLERCCPHGALVLSCARPDAEGWYTLLLASRDSVTGQLCAGGLDRMQRSSGRCGGGCLHPLQQRYVQRMEGGCGGHAAAASMMQHQDTMT